MCNTKKIEEIPVNFVLKQLNQYQKETVELNYFIYRFVKNYEGSKQQAFEELELLVNLSTYRIRDIFYRVDRSVNGRNKKAANKSGCKLK